ncbi:MAG: hypothetical protein HY763_00775 [Planctomycetes bacterium]|nr:hypothetical protein [Planctomycetota bacterium]
MSRTRVRLLAAYFHVQAVLLTVLLVVFWPERMLDTAGKEAWSQEIPLFFWSPLTIGHERRLLILVMLAAGWGSYVHAATSFTTYIGNRAARVSWTLWYVLRTPIGVGLALVAYFGIRGGLISAGASVDALSPFGVTGIAGVMGMFSKQAADKLKELFDVFFLSSPGREVQRRDREMEEAAATP